MADKATVYEHNQTVFVLDGHLKVMLEEDYLALQKHILSVIASEGSYWPTLTDVREAISYYSLPNSKTNHPS